MRGVLVGFTVLVTVFALNSDVEHLRDGRERLQGDARGRVRAAGAGPVLEARHATWARALDRARASSSGSACELLNPDAVGAAAAGGPRRELRGHDRRLARGHEGQRPSRWRRLPGASAIARRAVLAGLVLLYLAASVAVGLYAATRVRGASRLRARAGRFGTPIVTATVFATWFGAETVLGIPATFLQEGLRGRGGGPVRGGGLPRARGRASSRGRSSASMPHAGRLLPRPLRPRGRRDAVARASRCPTWAGSPRSSWRSASRSTVLLGRRRSTRARASCSGRWRCSRTRWPAACGRSRSPTCSRPR